MFWPMQGALLRVLLRLGESLIKWKYIFTINQLQTKNWYIFVLLPFACHLAVQVPGICAQPFSVGPLSPGPLEPVNRLLSNALQLPGELTISLG
jgi:hypothetical protein